MDEQKYRDRLRILLIIYFFSEDYIDPLYPARIRVLRSEVKIQKIDFWLRYPSHLSYQLLCLVHNSSINEEHRINIKEIVRKIFKDREPQLRTDEMERFLFGAYEDLDDVIAFLKSVGLIEFISAKDSRLQKTIHKEYFLTKFAEKSAMWYIHRCELIKRYFGNLSGTEIKDLQYNVDAYRETQWNKKIEDIEGPVKNLFHDIFNEYL